MSVSGISGNSAIQQDAISKLIGSSDMQSVLLAFGVERAQNNEQAVKAKIADMRERNNAINELRVLMSQMRTAEPNAVPEAAELKTVGEQMSNWGSAGGRSWMAPDFKDTLDKYGVPHKASNMDKSQMSTSNGGWTVSYPTTEYHQLGKDVQAKAENIMDGNDPNFPPTHVNLDKPLANGKTLGDVLKEAGIPLPLDKNGNPEKFVTKEQIGTMLENLETEVDRRTSNDQLDMIALQSMVSKQNNALEMVSNLAAKFAGLSDKIVGNMR
jgi:hypothetical protein